MEFYPNITKNRCSQACFMSLEKTLYKHFYVYMLLGFVQSKLSMKYLMFFINEQSGFF